MKIVFITDTVIGNTGWSRYAQDLAYACKKNGHEVLCLVENEDTRIQLEQNKCLGKPLSYVANPIVSFWSALRVNKIIAEFKPDIIQFVVEPYGSMIPFIRKSNIGIVLNAHSTFAYLPILVGKRKKKFAEFWAKLTYKKVDSVICISHYTKEHLLKHMRLIKADKYISQKIDIILGSLNLDNIPDPLPVKLNRNILFVGAIKPRKGLLEAIESLRYFKGDFIYRIVGEYSFDNPYVKLLIERIKKYNLEDKVIFVGQVSDEDLFKLYREADLFLMLSTNNGADFEGFGLVYIEANFYGVPCIGPNDCGVTDAILDGKTGYLVNQYNPVEVVERIEDILIYKKIKVQDCIEWAKKCSVNIRVKEFESVYKKIILKNENINSI